MCCKVGSKHKSSPSGDVISSISTMLAHLALTLRHDNESLQELAYQRGIDNDAQV